MLNACVHVWMSSRDALLECQLKYAMENIETMNLPVSRSMYQNRCVLQRFSLCSRMFLLFFSQLTRIVLGRVEAWRRLK